MDKLTNIPLAAITPSVHNPRLIQMDDPAIAELAKSIQAHGLLQPVVCRPMGDGFELLAGRRRYEACLLNNAETILAIVRDLDDKAAIEVTVLENLQREDLSPLEEARGVKELLASGREPSDVAARLGKSEVWVRRRARLMELTRDWIEALAGPLPNDPVRAKTIEEFRERVSVAVLEIAAHLPPKTQDAVLKDVLKDGWRVGLIAGSAAKFRELVSGHCRDLESTPWEWTDGDLGQVPCAVCGHRSDMEPDLFRDIGSDWDKDGKPIERAHCLDERCYKAKYEAWVKKVRTEAERKTKQSVLIVANGYNRNAPKGDVPSWQVKEAKKGDKGAVPVLHIEGKDAGKVKWAIVPEAKESTNHGQETEEAPDTVEVKRVKHMMEALRNWLEKQETCPPALCDAGKMLVAVAVYGCDLSDVIEDKSPAWFDKTIADLERFFAECWVGVKDGMRDNLYYRDWMGADKSEAELDLALHVCGLDKQDFLDDAEKAFPDEEKPAPKKTAKKGKKS